MHRVASAVTENEAQEAAAYFSRLRYVKAFRLVETGEIPAVRPLLGLYGVQPGGGREPLGDRIVETPNDLELFERRDNRPGYTIYIPRGAIARGRALASGDVGGRLPACASCHGVGLKGAIGPPLAGRYPAYLFRQLLGFSTGARVGKGAAVMAPVAQALQPSQMIDLASYAASLKP